MIKVKNISKKYEKKLVLENINLEIAPGGLIACIGPNGAGKSTFLSLISRLQPDYSGEIYLEESEIRNWHSKDLAKKLAILRQSNGIQLNISVRDLVSFGRYPYSKDRLSVKDKEIVEQSIHQMALEEMAEDSIHTLSGGQLQRVYIAMVLAQDTEYILLDEPLNNLDLNHANQMMHLLKKFAEEKNKTIIIVLHDINFAAGFADHIIAFKDGEVFADGPTEKIIEQQILRKLYGMDIRIHEIDGKKFCMYYN